MRNPLNKSLKKEFKNNIARYLSISIVMILMIAVVSGFLNVVYSAKDLLYKNQEECLVEDGQISFAEELDQETKDLLDKEPLKIYENFYSEQTIENYTTLRIYKNRENINLVTVYEGRLPVSSQEIALDRLFAEKNHYRIHDSIEIDHQKLEVVGYLSFPDYTSLIENNNDLMMDPIHFGVGIVNNEQFEQLSEKEITYNYSYLLNNRNASDKENYDQLNRIRDLCIKQNQPITSMLTKQMNQTISFLPNDMGGDIPMIQTLFIILLVILAFIFVVINQTIIEEQSAVIGTLLANGYTKKELIQHYMFIPMVIVIIGAIIGNILGYTLIPPVFAKMYYNSYCLPPLKLKFIFEAFMMTTLIPVIVMFIINLVMLSRKLTITPLRFLRRDLHKHKNRKYIHLKNSSFIKRFRTRVILQNKGSYMILFIGIIFASFLLMFGFMMTPSIEKYLDDMNDGIKTEYQYILKAPIEADGEKVTMSSLETHFDKDLDLDISLYGLEQNSDFYSDIVLPSNADEITISYDFAKKMNLKKGDEVTLTNPYTETDYQLTVSSIYHAHGIFSAYMSRKNLNQLLDYDNDYYNGYFSHDKLDIESDYIQSTITKDDILKIGEQMTQVFSQMFPIMTTVAIVIYLVVMYILTKLVLDRNTNEMSFLKVMGYDNREISKVYLQATMVVVIIALLISLPICKYGLEAMMILAFTRFSGYIEAYIPFYLFIGIFGIGIATYLIVNFILTKQIQRIELGSSLKETE